MLNRGHALIPRGAALNREHWSHLIERNSRNGHFGGLDVERVLRAARAVIRGTLASATSIAETFASRGFVLTIGNDERIADGLARQHEAFLASARAEAAAATETAATLVLLHDRHGQGEMSGLASSFSRRVSGFHPLNGFGGNLANIAVASHHCWANFGVVGDKELSRATAAILLGDGILRIKPSVNDRVLVSHLK